MSTYSADVAPDLKLFSVTPPCLRTNFMPTPPPAPIGSPPVEVTLTRETSVELLTQRYEAMTGTPLLSRIPPLPEPDGAYGFLQRKVLEPIVDMESVKVGKVHLTGGVVNAVKKKNPLCLLNPFVFAVDW